MAAPVSAGKQCRLANEEKRIQVFSRSSSSGGRVEFSSKPSDESLPDDDDERRKNYGGVYVGLPLDLSNVPQVQIGSLRETDRDSPSLRKPLWGGAL